MPLPLFSPVELKPKSSCEEVGNPLFVIGYEASLCHSYVKGGFIRDI